MKKANANVALYAVGGTGINIARQIRDLTLDISCIDTSASNAKDLPPHHSLYLLSDMDGAGKHRTLDTFQRFKEQLPKILLQSKPSDTLNIVLASLGGGSGSTGGPALASVLLDMGKNVIVIALDSTTSVIEMTNSLKALQSYRGVADACQKPLSMFYIENTSRREADLSAINFVNLLTLMTDKSRTDEFDVADLTSFLSFDRVTDNGPTLALLEFNENTDFIPEKGTHIAASVFLTKDRNKTLGPPVPDYLANCVVIDDGLNESEIRLDSVLGKSSMVAERLQARITASRESRQIHAANDLVVKADNNGMVF